MARFLRFAARAFRGFFRTPGVTPAAKRHIRSAARCLSRPRSEPVPGPLVRQPVSGLPAAVWTVAARVFRLWLLDRPDVGPRHACIAPLVRSVVLAISHDIFGPVRIVLQKRNGADAVGTRREGHNHRSALLVADQPRPHLVPAAHGAHLSDAPVIGRPEIDFVARSFTDPRMGRRSPSPLSENASTRPAPQTAAPRAACCPNNRRTRPR